MLRRRQVAASPRRGSTETWEVISQLVIDTVTQSRHLTSGEVVKSMSAAAPVGRMLVAGGHLESQPLTLVVGKTHAEISTVAGVTAIQLDEELDPIPGAADATDFMIYLPSPTPLQKAIADAINGDEHLADSAPPVTASETETGSAASAPLIDLDALRRTDR